MAALTEEQNDFLQAEGKVILRACPGSGKTFIVGQKLIKYLEKWPHPYRGVAVLSFTNVASEEILKQTTVLACKKPISVEFPHYIGTLDSFINNMIFLRFGYLIQSGDRRRPKIVFDNFGSLPFPKKQCHENGCVSNLNWFHWSDSQLLKLGQPISCDVPPPRPCAVLKRSMLQKGFANQKEVPALSLLLLKKHPEIAQRVAYRFPVIIVDEAQDTSREQMEILDFLSDNGLSTIIFVGDPDQAIYEWRDATPEYFKAKLIDPQWRTMHLTANFRSSQNICNATAKFSSFLSTRDPAHAKGEHSDFATKPILLQVASGKSKDDIIEKFKLICNANGIDVGKDRIAILTRGRIHTDTDISNLWQNVQTKQLAKATYQWHCGSKNEAFIQCEAALFGIENGRDTPSTTYEIRKEIEKHIDYTLWKQKIVFVLSLLPLADSSLQEWQRMMVEKLTELNQCGKIIVPAGINASELIRIKSRTKIDGSYSTEFLNKPLRSYFEKRTTGNITISSVHGVKGETFEASLLIVDSTRGATLTPANLNTGSLDSELMRIAYVAMTRPKKLLVVSIPKQKSGKQFLRFPHDLWDYQEL